MDFSADANGITIRKLFGKVEISYLTDDFPVIFDAIERYNMP